MEHAKKRSSGGVIAVIISVVLIFVLAAVVLIVCLVPDNSDGGAAVSSGSESTKAEEPSESMTQTSVYTTVDTTTPAPVVTESIPVTDTVVVTDVPETDPHQGYVPPADRNTDFSQCLFIGDSRTQGLMMYSGVQGATAYASRGLMVDTFFTVPVVDMNGSKVSVADAVSANNGFKYVYIMFGINELGWPYEEVFRERYAKVVDHVKGAMPDAKIVVQSIIPVTDTKSASDDVYNNTRIKVFNSLIRDMCEEKGVTYFDLVPILGDESGALPEDAAFDGIHLQKPYCQKWLDSLRSVM